MKNAVTCMKITRPEDDESSHRFVLSVRHGSRRAVAVRVTRIKESIQRTCHNASSKKTTGVKEMARFRMTSPEVASRLEALEEKLVSNRKC